MISSPQENEDIDFEPEDEMGSLGAAKAKMQKLRDQLKEAQEKRDEYLDGWQRAKADMINAKKDASEALKRAGNAGRESIVEDLIPALDGFDMAMQSPAWQNVDSAWRTGVESIRAQISGVLASNGIEIYGKTGDAFDPMLHEAIHEEDGGTPHTIAKVLRSGYRVGDRILRAAQVSIFK